MSQTIGEIAACIAAIITILNTLLTTRTQRKVAALHAMAEQTLGEVVTLNGKTIGKLADNAEGRRIAADIPVDQQSSHDKRYVEAVEASDAAPPPA